MEIFSKNIFKFQKWERLKNVTKAWLFSENNRLYPKSRGDAHKNDLNLLFAKHKTLRNTQNTVPC